MAKVKKKAVRPTRPKQLSEDESDLRQKYHELELRVDRLSGYANEPRTSLCALQAQFDAYAENVNGEFENMNRRDESVHAALSQVRESAAEHYRHIATLAERVGAVEKELQVGMLNKPTLSERMDHQTTVNASIFTRLSELDENTGHRAWSTYYPKLSMAASHFMVLDRLTALERPGFFRRLWRKVRRK